jgi:hypothetical protein
MIGKAELGVKSPSGFCSKMVAVPGETIRLAGSETVNWVEFTKVGDNLISAVGPYQNTIAPGWNPIPLIVSVKAGPPVVADAGLRLEMVGRGALIVKVTALEFPEGL